ncbi:MAG: DUF4956 domain-containing protein [Eubacteriales bacterium]|nr:DUF4956 domain-containing protein [Eubacteriales bacterium]MDD3880954.1 DUF4956 domain-containing protein [Eubacteriales bacterium]
MLNSIIPASGLTLASVLASTLCALLCGAFTAFVYSYKNAYTKSFAASLVLMPVIVEAVIMLVSGNLGTGVAVMGAFSLVRFRSVPGSARDMLFVFLAMAAGLAAGTGYVLLAAVVTLLVGAGMLIIDKTKLFEPKAREREIRITIPENLDYDGLFDDLFAKYLLKAELVRVKTTNMGSLYELSYRVTLRDESVSKSFIDALRCRNGNLGIVCGRVSTIHDEL